MSDIAPDLSDGSEPVETLDTSIEDAGTETLEGVETETETQAPVVEDPFAEFGGREEIEKARRLYEAASTEEGVIQLWIEAGRTLGLTVEQMQGLFGAQAQEPDPEELERPVTVAELRELERQRQEQQSRVYYEQQQQAMRAQAGAAVHEAVKEIGLPGVDDPTAQIVLRLGDQYLDKRNPTPEAVRNAVRRGYADYQAEIQRQAQEYTRKKVTQAASVPGAPSGGQAPSTPPPAEPKNVEEAIQMFRERFSR